MPAWLEWLAALAEVTAGVCLAIPALRLSRHPLQLDEIHDDKQQRQDELERLRGKYVSAMSRLLSKWDHRDHWLLRIGFSAFVLAALLKLIGVALAG